MASKPAQVAQAAATTTDEVDQINKRLTKILETRLDTDKVKLVCKRHLQRMLGKVTPFLSRPMRTQEALEALADLSTFFITNTLQTRRNLRSQIERRSLAINADFLAAFGDVKDSFDAVCTDIASMTASITHMQQRLRTTQSQTHELIQQTNALQASAGRLQLHQQVAGAFLHRFQLTLDEHQQLYGTGAARDGAPAPITAAFFTVLARVQAIHGECRVLLQSGYQTAALDIMEEMTLHQEAALEQLYRWTQNHCRNVVASAADGGDGIGALVVAAMHQLQDRPVLFKYVVDEYATARRAVLVRNFIDALTVGGGVGCGGGGGLRPIELHAHDPKRYIGDMFAWIHQAVPLEKENLLALLRDCDRGDCADAVQPALAHISDGLCAPLKVRVETVLNAERDLIVLYAVSNLMRFYQTIVGQVVRGGQLDECLGALQAFSEQAYLGALGAQVRSLLLAGGSGNGGGGSTTGSGCGGLEPPQSDLVPPHGVARLLGVLKEILSVASMVESRQHDITKVRWCRGVVRVRIESTPFLPLRRSSRASSIRCCTPSPSRRRICPPSTWPCTF